MKILLILFCYCCTQVWTYEMGANSTKAYPQPDACLKFLFNAQMNRGKSFLGKNKCAEETYKFGHQYEKFKEDCLIEPANETMSYSDSIWTFYKCIVQKSLGTTGQLTLSNYAKMMASNLSETTRTAILTVLQNNHESLVAQETNNLPKNNTESSDPELEDIKKYWKYYFDAEYQVCINVSSNPCNQSSNKHENHSRGLQRNWGPAQNCQGEVVVDYRGSNDWSAPLSFWESVNGCVKSLNESHPVSNLTFEIQYSFYQLCHAKHKGIIIPTEMEMETRLVDLASFYNNNTALKLFSKSVKQNLFNHVRCRFGKKFDKFREAIRESESINEVLSFAADHLKIKLSEQGEKAENILFLTNAIILKSLMEVEASFAMKMCYNYDYDYGISTKSKSGCAYY